MKFTPEVVAALEVLRAAAENDFERHRIDVLEQDLHEPPKVEVVDNKHQKFDGVLYNLEKNAHYYGKLSVQRAVWTYYNGEIPTGCQIHHADENAANNAIENLQCLSAGAHRRLHAELASYKHLVCKHCGKIFSSKKINPPQYCSRLCYRKHEAALKQEGRVCIICGEKFSCSRYSRTQTCSRECAAKMRYQNHVSVDNSCSLSCIICGATFVTNKYRPAKTCSRSCAKKLADQTRKNQSPNSDEK